MPNPEQALVNGAWDCEANSSLFYSFGLFWGCYGPQSNKNTKARKNQQNKDKKEQRTRKKNHFCWQNAPRPKQYGAGDGAAVTAATSTRIANVDLHYGESV